MFWDDTEWQAVSVPHDFAIAQPLDMNANLDQAYRPRGIAWYRRYLRFEEKDRGKAIELKFEGIATHTQIWVNGISVARSWSGYSAINIDITPYITFGDQYNTVAIRVDASSIEGWWYEGAGIYRTASVIKRNAVHIATDGVYANPVRTDRGWSIPVEVSLRNLTKATAPVTIKSELIDNNGNILSFAEVNSTVTPLEDNLTHLTLSYANPDLWSPETPHLYKVRTQAYSDGLLIDEVQTNCGFRYFHFDSQHGFYLNGAKYRMQGVCLHHDHAGVGVAVPTGISEFRYRKLKELGCNAIRWSHNAVSEEVMDACARHGFLVMAENRHLNLSAEYMAQLKWLVRRDRNNPAVIMWSVFNEEPIQGSRTGYEMVRQMAHQVKQLDRTRPVTAAISDGYFNAQSVIQAVDVAGVNYGRKIWDKFHEMFPTIPVISSEDTSAYQTRGIYETDEDRHYKAAYDDDASTWGDTHRKSWNDIKTRPFLSGAFVWMGFDYHGEPTPYAWPSNISQFGIMDLCGFEKTAFWIRQAQWLTQPVLHLVPHWNWAEKEGIPVTVMALHNMDEVELFLNDQSLGRQKGNQDEMNRWQVPFHPGTLCAIGFRDGVAVKQFEVSTTGQPDHIRLVPDRTVMSGDGEDVQPIRVEVLDNQGRAVPDASNLIKFRVENGDILGVGNGDPTSLESEVAPQRRLFNGLAQLIIRTREHSRGTLRVSASGQGLQPHQLEISVVAASGMTRQGAATPYQPVEDWHISQLLTTLPQTLDAMDLSDEAQWRGYWPSPTLRKAQASGIILLAADLRPVHKVQRHGGILRFSGIAGRFTIFVDGVIASPKTTGDGSTAEVNLDPKRGTRQICVAFAVDRDRSFGLTTTPTLLYEFIGDNK